MTIALTVEIKVNPGREADFERIAVQAARTIEEKEPGNLLYRVHKTEDPQTYLIIERYVNNEALEAHTSSDHVAEIVPQFEGIFAVEPKGTIYEELD